MNYSELIETAALQVMKKKGCGFISAVDYIENNIFNTDCDIMAFFDDILTKKYYGADKCKPYRSKGRKRDFWHKMPYEIREQKYYGMDPAEYLDFIEKCKSKSADPEVRIKFRSIREQFSSMDFVHNKRHYDRRNGLGPFCGNIKESYYGCFTKEAKRSRQWKKELYNDLKDEHFEAKPLRIH